MSDLRTFSADSLGNVRLYLTGSSTLTKAAGSDSASTVIDLPQGKNFIYDITVKPSDADGFFNMPYNTFTSVGYWLSSYFSEMIPNAADFQPGLWLNISSLHSTEVAREITATFNYTIYEIDLIL